MSEPSPLAPIHVIGGGLAGSEAAWQIARQHAAGASRNPALAQTPEHRTCDEHHLEVMKTAD
jgi:folate-dependent tRNA-U54 methylase TrmFO/GidA